MKRRAPEEFFLMSTRIFCNKKLNNISCGAFRLWVNSIGFGRFALSDGFVDESQLRSLSPARRLAPLVRELVKAGLWHVVDGGWQVHDYAEWNQTRAEVESARREVADRVKKHRDGAAPAPSTPPPRPKQESGAFDRETGARLEPTVEEALLGAGVDPSFAARSGREARMNEARSRHEQSTFAARSPRGKVGFEAETGFAESDVTRYPRGRARSESEVEYRDQETPLPPEPTEAPSGARGPGGGGFEFQATAGERPAPGLGGGQAAPGHPGGTLGLPPPTETRPAPEQRRSDPPPDAAPVSPSGPSAEAILASLRAKPALEQVATARFANVLAAFVDGGGKKLDWVLAAVDRAGDTAEVDDSVNATMQGPKLARFVRGAVAICTEQTAINRATGGVFVRPPPIADEPPPEVRPGPPLRGPSDAQQLRGEALRRHLASLDPTGELTGAARPKRAANG
jgi:hypothetical protein